MQNRPPLSFRLKGTEIFFASIQWLKKVSMIRGFNMAGLTIRVVELLRQLSKTVN